MRRCFYGYQKTQEVNLMPIFTENNDLYFFGIPPCCLTKLIDALNVS